MRWRYRIPRILESYVKAGKKSLEWSGVLQCHIQAHHRANRREEKQAEGSYDGFAKYNTSNNVLSSTKATAAASFLESSCLLAQQKRRICFS